MTNTKRKNITQPGDWWTAFERTAEGEGMTLSEWMGECCKANVWKPMRDKLSERPAANRPTKGESDV